jgi:N-acetylmuramic acid 6-phosphate (MurNAc-6-P) etherase
MLGISILAFCSRNLPYSKARQSICLSIGITFIGLACTGSYELIIGTVNYSILTAIGIEIILGFSFLIILFINRKTTIVQ